MPGMRYQPQRLIRLNRSNPLGARVLEYLPLGIAQRGLMSGDPVTFGPGGSVQATPRGIALRGSGSGERARVPFNLSDKPKLSIAFWLSWDAFANDDRLAFELTPDAAPSFSGGFAFDPNSSSGRVEIFGAYRNTATFSSNFARPSAGQLHRYMIVFDGTTVPALYINGVAQSPAIALDPGGAGEGWASGATLNLLSRNGTALFGLGSLQDVVFYDGALSAREALSDYQNPWQIFEGEDDDAPAEAAASYSLTVDRAALTVTGGQVGMKVSRRLRAAPAALTVAAGQVAMRAARRLRTQPAGLALATGPVSVRASRRLTVQPAALDVLAGQVRMAVSRRLGVQPAALAVTGQGVALRAGRRLKVAPASLALAAGPVGMQYAPAPLAGSYTLPVSAAAMTLGGGSVRMRVTRRLPVAGAQLGLAGGNVLFQVGRLPGLIDVSAISRSRIVTFEGSGSRLVIFEGSGSRVVVFEGSGQRVRVNNMDVKVPAKVGEKWVTDRDRDEISYYGADITNELAHRNTTPDTTTVSALVYGVELLEGPQVQVAEIDGDQRTLVVVKLGGIDGADLPEDWRWVARVPCENGERFDKTTWFNEVDP